MFEKKSFFWNDFTEENASFYFILFVGIIGKKNRLVASISKFEQITWENNV